jgi:hypothetical protein
LVSAGGKPNVDADPQRRGMRLRVRQIGAKASRKVQNFVAGPAPIAGVLTDAAANAAELAAEEVRSAALDALQRRATRNEVVAAADGASASAQLETQARVEADAQIAMSALSLAKTSVADAFDAADTVLSQAEEELRRMRAELDAAKRDATLGLAVAEKAASEAAARARRVTESVVREVALSESREEREHAVVEDGEGSSGKEEITQYSEANTVPPSQKIQGSAAGETADAKDVFDISDLSYEDVDDTLTDMAPPFINEDECLVPGEPVVRVEKAPQNSRRIFAGIDIPVSVDDVWNLLTDYPNLQQVIPNLVVNEVLELYPGNGGDGTARPPADDGEEAPSAAAQCERLATDMKGAVLRQVGGAKVRASSTNNSRQEWHATPWLCPYSLVDSPSCFTLTCHCIYIEITDRIILV